MEYVLYIPRTRKRGFRTMGNNCKTQVKMASESKTDRPHSISFHCISDFLSMLCCLFYAEKKIYFYLKTTKENSQKFIVSKMTGQHFTGNILTSHYDKYGRSCPMTGRYFDPCITPEIFIILGNSLLITYQLTDS